MKSKDSPLFRVIELSERNLKLTNKGIEEPAAIYGLHGDLSDPRIRIGKVLTLGDDEVKVRITNIHPGRAGEWFVTVEADGPPT